MCRLIFYSVNLTYLVHTHLLMASIIKEQANSLWDRAPHPRLHAACRHNAILRFDLLRYSAVTRRAVLQAFLPRPQGGLPALHQSRALRELLLSTTDHRSGTHVKVSLHQQNACNQASGYRQPNPVIRPPNSRDWIIKRKWEQPQVRSMVCALASVENKMEQDAEQKTEEHPKSDIGLKKEAD